MGWYNYDTRSAKQESRSRGALKRSYHRDIGYAALALGALMSFAGFGALVISIVLPNGAPSFPGGMGWVMTHQASMASLQLAAGLWLLFWARAYLRGQPLSRVILRWTLAAVTLGMIAFSIVWVPGIGSFVSGMPGASHGPLPIIFSIVALFTSLSIIVPLTLAVWYLGKAEAKVGTPV